MYIPCICSDREYICALLGACIVAVAGGFALQSVVIVASSFWRIARLYHAMLISSWRHLTAGTMTKHVWRCRIVDFGTDNYVTQVHTHLHITLQNSSLMCAHCALSGPSVGAMIVDANNE